MSTPVRVWISRRVCDEHITIEIRDIHLKLSDIYKNSAQKEFAVNYRNSSLDINNTWRWGKDSWRSDYSFLVTSGVYPESRPIIESFNILWKMLYAYSPDDHEIENISSEAINEIAKLVELCHREVGNALTLEESMKHPGVQFVCNVLYGDK